MLAVILLSDSPPPPPPPPPNTVVILLVDYCSCDDGLFRLSLKLKSQQYLNIIFVQFGLLEIRIPVNVLRNCWWAQLQFITG